MRKKTEKNLIGWREWIGLPDLSVRRIKAKIDTGAKTSALHAFDIHQYLRQGKRFVRFKIHPFQRSSKGETEAHARLIEERMVRSSLGEPSLRPVILTDVLLDNQRWPIELTLVNRDVMGFRMLVGRQAIRHRFVVDPGNSYLASSKKKKGRR